MMNLDTMRLFRLMTPDDESGQQYDLDYVDTGAILCGYLETSSPEFAAMVDGDYGRTFRLFVDDFNIDVRVGDRLKDDNDVTYDVKGVLQNRKNPGRRTEIVLTLPIKQ